MTKAQMLILVSELTNLRHAFTELLARKLTMDMELALDPDLESDPEIISVRSNMAQVDKELSAKIVALKKRIDDGFKTKFVSKVSFGEIIPRKPPEADDDPQLTNSAAPRDVLFHQN